MKRKLLFTFLGILFSVTILQAQVTYGVRTGLNISKWQGDDLKIIEDLIDKTNGYLVTKSKTGIHLGGYANIPLSESLSFEPGLQYSNKGYRLAGDFKINILKFLGINAGVQVKSHYIDIPLLLKANVADGLEIFGGPQVSFLTSSSLNAKVSVLGISLVNKGYDITERFNRVDMGLTGGLGYQFENGINLRAGYDYGLSKLDKNDNYAASNRVVKVSLGYRF